MQTANDNNKNLSIDLYRELLKVDNESQKRDVELDKDLQKKLNDLDSKTIKEIAKIEVRIATVSNEIKTNNRLLRFLLGFISTIATAEFGALYHFKTVLDAVKDHIS